MAEIDVKITELNDAISKLQNLRLKCDSLNTNAPTTVGGGQTVNELESIAEVYKMMNKDLGDLISNTVSFLQNVRDSFISSDIKAAKGITN